MDSSLSNKNFGCGLDGGLRWKNIKQARVINKYQKKCKMVSLSLTDDKGFEKEAWKWKQDRGGKRYEDVLRMEIENKACQALKSIHSVSVAKDCWNLRSFRKGVLRGVCTNFNSPIDTERAELAAVEDPSLSGVLNTPKAKKWEKGGLKFVESKENLEFGVSRKSQESQFISKVKEATLKLREMRRRCSLFH